MEVPVIIAPLRDVTCGTLIDSHCRGSLSSPLLCSRADCGWDRQLTGAKKALIKIDIINRVVDRTGVPKLQAEQAVDALFHSMKAALTRGDRIELRGFGVFAVKPRKRGVGRNPRTGQEVAIPSGKTIRFKPGKQMQVREGGEQVTRQIPV
jgi:DNA-binding protein HU-beta